MNMYNPYIMPMQQTQDLGGLNPVYQNIGAQQAMQNAAMQQAQGLTQDAGRTVQGGMNPMAMAMMLRKGQDKQNINAANAEMANFNMRPAQNYYSAGMNPNNIISDI
jgi:hypothetical protein